MWRFAPRWFPRFCVSLVVLQPWLSGGVKTNYDFVGCLLFGSCCCESAFCTCLHPEQRLEAQRAPFPVFPTPRPLPELPLRFRSPKRLLSWLWRVLRFCGCEGAAWPHADCSSTCAGSQTLSDGLSSLKVSEDQFNEFHVDFSVRKMFLFKNRVGFDLSHNEKCKTCLDFLISLAVDRLNFAFNWIN